MISHPTSPLSPSHPLPYSSTDPQAAPSCPPTENTPLHLPSCPYRSPPRDSCTPSPLYTPHLLLPVRNGVYSSVSLSGEVAYPAGSGGVDELMMRDSGANIGQEAVEGERE